MNPINRIAKLFVFIIIIGNSFNRRLFAALCRKRQENQFKNETNQTLAAG